MSLVDRERAGSRTAAGQLPREAHGRQPEHWERQREDASPRDSSKPVEVAIVKQAVRKTSRPHHKHRRLLAYYAFLSHGRADGRARPFSVLADPSAIQTLVDKLGSVMPEQATELIEGSLTRMSENARSGFAVLAVGLVFALWSLTGAMQNLMWALNLAYDREESRASAASDRCACDGDLRVPRVRAHGRRSHSWPTSLRMVRRSARSRDACAVGMATWAMAPSHRRSRCRLRRSSLFGPDVEERRWSLLTLGTAIAVVAWLLVSAAFAIFKPVRLL